MGEFDGQENEEEKCRRRESPLEARPQGKAVRELRHPERPEAVRDGVLGGRPDHQMPIGVPTLREVGVDAPRKEEIPEQDEGEA